MTDLFPRGIAKGNAFYDRVVERKKLKQNIERTIHTVLIAPRRYGKTSLITQVVYENKIDHLWIDFMTITSREDIQTKLLQKISTLIVQIAPTTEKLKQLVVKYFNNLKPEIILSISGISLKLNPGEFQKEEITEALSSLDNLAKGLKRRLVIVFDEFQEILRIDRDLTLQGSIRHAVERAEYITYVFSGSKHLPLKRMFNGRAHPLYSLCENMEINKIADGEYINFINKAAMGKWGSPLNSEVLLKILNYSDRYPKYINILCGAIWGIDMLPTCEIIDELWHAYILSKKTDITEDLSSLTLNQLRLLQWLCFNPTTELYSKDTLAALKMSQSSVQKAIKILLEKDFVIEEKSIFRVLDPTVISYFKYS